MGDIIYRAFEPQLEIKTRANGGAADGRTIMGIAIPYNAPTRIDDRLTEEFVSGAFDHQLRAAHRVKLFRGHYFDGSGGALIGRTMTLQDTPEGLYGEWRVSRTAMGDDTLELIKDGTLEELSIGFRERQNRRGPGGVTVRASADLLEVAVVLQGAYGELAGLTGTRSMSTTPHTDAIAAALAALPQFKTE